MIYDPPPADLARYLWRALGLVTLTVWACIMLIGRSGPGPPPRNP